MTHFLAYCVVVLLNSFLSYINGERVPIIQSLQFEAADGSVFTIRDFEQPDMSTYTNLINFLRKPNLNRVCVEGTWQFYDLKNFEHSVTKTGLVLKGTGKMNQSNLRIPSCLPFTRTNGTQYARKLSYRILGPEDLSQRSVTFYEKINYAGREFKVPTLPTASFNPMTIFTISLPTVGSFRITSQTDDDPANPGDPNELRTIIKVSIRVNPTNGVTPATCYAMVNPLASVNNPKSYNINQTRPGEIFAAVQFIDLASIQADCQNPDVDSLIRLPPST